MRGVSDSLRARIEQYCASVPLLFADAEEFGPLRLFARKEPRTPCYGGPSYAQPTAKSAGSVAAADIARVRARQCELGVPEAFEWLAEAAPALRARIEAVGLPVAERPLMVLDPHLSIPLQPLPDDVTIRVLTADDPALPAAPALPRLAFATEGTAVGAAGRAELSAAAEEATVDGTVESFRSTVRAGYKTPIAPLESDCAPLAVVLLVYAEESAARMYCRLDFFPADVTLLIANQPARS
ncbi:GNAT family N-acetyltransferase [Streptomyces sp. WAC07094]|uniref:GNAT family N-acetyltransferase n=1 Tax=Streptomyces sp. WAC07094 TaxID=3072183 RepID=UPI002EA5F33A|nr:GNAT family N-acetyltransferase [Streptomyces sp. WAC07094]